LRARRTREPQPATGEVRVQVDALRHLSRLDTMPFQLDEEHVDETLRLRYRWLDMRRIACSTTSASLTRVIAAIRRAMDAMDFIDVWTPA